MSVQNVRLESGERQLCCIPRHSRINNRLPDPSRQNRNIIIPRRSTGAFSQAIAKGDNILPAPRLINIIVPLMKIPPGAHNDDTNEDAKNNMLLLYTHTQTLSVCKIPARKCTCTYARVTSHYLTL